MSDSRTTVCIVPREGFTVAIDSLKSVLDGNDPPGRIVYVDGGAPPAVRDELRRMAQRHDFTLLRTEHYLAPNEARNLAFGHVDTEFVAFVDNDVYVSPGWLGGLERAADAHGAAVVAPVYGISRTDPSRPVVHLAGAENHFVEVDGRRHHEMAHHHIDEDLATLLATLRPAETEQAEFHCFFARTDAIVAIGGFDEDLRSLHEHLDASLRIREQDGTIWLEPSVVVTYFDPAPAWPDRRFYILRWSREWNTASVERFARTWDVDPDDPETMELLFHAERRRFRAYRPFRSIGGRILGWFGRQSRPLPDRVIAPLVVWREERRRARRRPPVRSHRASWDAER